MSHPPRRRFGFLRDAAVSLGMALALWASCEVTLRVARPQVSRTEWIDGRSRAVEDSVLGHRYRPGARAIQRTPEFTAEYIIDAEGRRAGTSAVDTSGVRVLVLGDSFTFGDGVAAKEVWTAVMEHALRTDGIAVGVVNAGVEGYDTRAETHYLFELAPVVKPDVVVLGFVANDVYTNQPLEAAAPRSVAEQRAPAHPSHVVALAKRLVMHSDWVYQHLFLVTARKEYYSVPMTAHVAEQLQVTRDLLATMDEFCRERGIRFAVVSIPQQFGTLASARDEHYHGLDPNAIDADLAAFAREHGFPWIEMLDPLARAYRTTGVDMYYRVDGHLTRAGQRIVGERAAAAIPPLLSTRSIGRGR